jgi:hypothetical protein
MPLFLKFGFLWVHEARASEFSGDSMHCQPLALAIPPTAWCSRQTALSCFELSQQNQAEGSPGGENSFKAVQILLTAEKAKKT